jgi:hypothetical protein
MPVMFTLHTRPWHVIVSQIGAGACTLHVEVAATIYTSNAVGYPLTAGFTFTLKIIGHLRYIYINSFAIL